MSQDHSAAPAATHRRLPTWVPYVAFCLVVVAVAAVAVVVAVRSEQTSDPAAPASERASRLPPGDTPEGAAVRALRFLAVGTLPNVAELYHPDIVEHFGYNRLARALALRRPGLSGQQFSVSFREPARAGGELVVVRSAGPQGDGEYFFVLRQAAGRWQIIHDSLLGDGLTELARIQASAGNTGERPAQAAERAAARVAEAYRRLLLDPA